MRGYQAAGSGGHHRNKGIFERKAQRGSLQCCGRRRVEGQIGGGCTVRRAEPGPGTGEGMLLLTQRGTGTGRDLENHQRHMGGVAWGGAAVCTLC